MSTGRSTCSPMGRCSPRGLAAAAAAFTPSSAPASVHQHYHSDDHQSDLHLPLSSTVSTSRQSETTTISTHAQTPT